MTRSEQLLEKVVESLAELNEKVGRQEGRLEEHMRRTEIAESNIDRLAAALGPVQTHVTQVQSGFKLVVILGTVIAFLTGTGLTIWQTLLK